MLRLLNCPRGHFWESAQEDAPEACPECGGPAESLPLLDLAPTAAPPPPLVEAEPPLFDAARVPVVSGYQVLDELGRTPAGVRHYRARQAVTGRTVLLEVVAAREEASEQAWNRLRGEATALGKLAHPNVVRIYEAGQRDRQLFYNVTELVEGPTLAQKVADKPLPVAQVVRLMELLARAVAYAHAAGLLHRNLRPSAVLLQPAGEADDLPAACVLHSGAYVPRLTAFGLARKPIEGDTTDVELYGDEVGFLSPEQAWGRAKDIGPATDVYGLGAILYFLLTGRPPFRGPNTAEVLDAIQTADLVSPSRKRRVPADVEAICKKCLARPPRRRYATAGELADDLRRAAQGLPVSARPLSGAEAIARWVRRRPSLAALLLVAALAAVAVPVAYLAGRGDDLGPHTKAIDQQVRAAHEQHAQTRLALEAARLELGVWKYRQRLDDVRWLMAERRLEDARALLEQVGDFQDRGFEWHYLHRAVLGEGKIDWREKFGAVSGLAFPPGPAGYLAVAVNLTDKEVRGEVRLWDYTTGHVWQRLPFDGRVHAVAVSPDGQQLAAAGEDGDRRAVLRVFNLSRGPNRGRLQHQVPVRGERLTDAAYVGLDWRILVAQADGRLARIDGGAGTVVEWTSGPPDAVARRPSVSRLAATPDGDHAAVFLEGGSEVRVWEAVGSFRLTRSYRDLGEVHAAAVDREGRLAVARADRTILLYDSSGGGEVAALRGLPRPARRLAFSPDGSRLAAACDDGKVRLWRQAGAAWLPLLELDARATDGLVFSPSGRALATAGDGLVTLWGAP